MKTGTITAGHDGTSHEIITGISYEELEDLEFVCWRGTKASTLLWVDNSFPCCDPKDQPSLTARDPVGYGYSYRTERDAIEVLQEQLETEHAEGYPEQTKFAVVDYGYSGSRRGMHLGYAVHATHDGYDEVTNYGKHIQRTEEGMDKARDSRMGI